MHCLFYLFCFASGAAALVYELAWVRILSVDFGHTVYAISTVLCVFMGGLALGSYLFGRWIDNALNPLRVYCVLEIALALYAAAFVAAVPTVHRFAAWLLTGHAKSGMDSTVAKFLLAVTVLLPPTTLMGGTLPILARCVSDSPISIGARLGNLYAFNTLGAVIGCLVQANVLILLVGVRGTVLLAAGINLFVGIGAAIVSRGAPLRRGTATDKLSHPTTADHVEPIPSERRLSAGLVYAVSFVSGFVALAAEVLWTRLFVNQLSSSVLVFSTVLAAFLGGLSLGSFVVAHRVDRIGRRDLLLGATLIASALCLVGSVLGQPALGELFHWILGPSLPLPSAAKIYACLAVMFLLMALAATVFGAVMPLLLRCASRRLESLGRDVGRLLVFNTAGAIAGSVLAGFLLIRLAGVNGSLLLLATLYAAVSVCVLTATRPRGIGWAATTVCMIEATIPAVRQPIVFSNGGFTQLVRVPADQMLYVAEGVEATVAVTQDNGVRDLLVNGIIVAETSRRDLWDLLLKTHLPMLLHEDPRRVAIVGLGAGISLGAVEAYDVDRVDCAEISAEVVQTQRFFDAFNNHGLHDERLNLVINDGRHFLLSTGTRYDVISVDPVDPPVCNLYSREFFQLCHGRLRQGGLMVQWVPLFRLSPIHIQTIGRAFSQVFPHTTLWYDGTSLLLIGHRDGPLRIDVERFLRRAGQPRVKKSLALIGRPEPMMFLANYVTGPTGLDELIGHDVPENSDDFPYLEYAILAAGVPGREDLAANLEMIRAHFAPTDEWLARMEAPLERVGRLTEIRELMREFLQIRIDLLRGERTNAKQRLQEATRRFRLRADDLENFAPFVSGEYGVSLAFQQRRFMVTDGDF